MKCRGCENEVVQPRRGRRIWCSERCRKRTLYSEPCEDCGALHGGRANRNGDQRPQRFCAECARRHSAEAQQRYGEAVRAEVSALWLEGLPIREIARIMGWAPGSLGSAVVRYRRQGYEDEFPLRNRVSAEGRRRMSETAKRTRAREHRAVA